MKDLKPNDQRARIAIIFFIIIAMLEAANFLGDFVEYGYMANFDRGVTIRNEKIELLEIIQGILGLAYLLIFILVIIMLIRWFRRAYYNLALFVRTDSTDGWAAGAWFIPFYNLYKPKRIMMELYDKTNSILKMDNPKYERRDTGMVSIWWLLWILSNIGTNISTRWYLRADTAQDYMRSLSLSMPMSIMSIIAAILLIFIIKKYAFMEQLLVEMNEKEDQTLITIQ